MGVQRGSDHLRLQPGPPPVAAWTTYGCSLDHLRLQALFGKFPELAAKMNTHVSAELRRKDRVFKCALPVSQFVRQSCQSVSQSASQSASQPVSQSSARARVLMRSLCFITPSLTR